MGGADDVSDAAAPEPVLSAHEVRERLERHLHAARLRPHPSARGFTPAERFAGIVLCGFVLHLAERYAAGEPLRPADHAVWVDGLTALLRLPPVRRAVVWDWCCDLATADAAAATDSSAHEAAVTAPAAGAAAGWEVPGPAEEPPSRLPFDAPFDEPFGDLFDVSGGAVVAGDDWWELDSDDR